MICLEGIQPCNMDNRAIYWRRYKKKMHIGQRHIRPLQSGHLGASRSSPSHHQLPCHVYPNRINGLKSLPLQWWFEFWKKPEVMGHQIWAVGGLSHLDNLMFCQKTLHETWWMSRCIVVMKLPIAVACWIVWILSAEEHSSLMHNLMQIHCSAHSVILNVTDTAHGLTQ